MPKSSADKKFVAAFKKHVIDHLRGVLPPLDGQKIENPPRDIIEQAKGSMGKLSRVFDMLIPRLPIFIGEAEATHSSLIQAVQDAEGFSNYLLPTLQALAPTILNSNQTGLNKDIIAAIGVEDYAKIVKGKVKKNAEDEEVVAEPGDEEAFALREADVARQFMSAVVMAYSGAVLPYSVSPETLELERLQYEISNTNRLLRGAALAQIKDIFFTVVDQNQFFFPPAGQRVSDRVIEAIGKDKYAQLVEGRVVDGKVVHMPEKEAIFQEKQYKLFRLLGEALATRYGLTASDVGENYNVNDETLSLYKDELPKILDKIETQLPPSEEISLGDSLEDFDAKVARGQTKAEEVIQGKNLLSITACLKECDKLYDVLYEKVSTARTPFTTTVLVPGNDFALDFRIGMLTGSLDQIPPLEEVERMMKSFVDMLNQTQEEIELLKKSAATTKEHALRYQEAEELITNTQDKLARADIFRETKKGDPTALRNSLWKNFNEALDFFKHGAEAAIKAHPPAPLMNIFLRLLRSIFIWSMKSKAEQADEKRYQEEVRVVDTMKGKLKEIKNADPPAAAIEPQTGEEPTPPIKP